MAATTSTEPKTSTVSGDYDIETNGTIVTVLDADAKKSLSARLAKDNDDASLSDYSHAITTEDYSNGVVTVRVSATATPKGK